MEESPGLSSASICYDTFSDVNSGQPGHFVTMDTRLKVKADRLSFSEIPWMSRNHMTSWMDWSLVFTVCFTWSCLKFFSKSWEYEYQVQNAFMLSCRLQYELCSKLHCTATGITEFSVEQRQDLQVGKTIITMYVGVYWAQALCEMYRGAWRLIWHSPWPNRFIAVE